MRCPRCGAEVSGIMNYCPYCGIVLRKEITALLEKLEEFKRIMNLCTIGAIAAFTIMYISIVAAAVTKMGQFLLPISQLTWSIGVILLIVGTYYGYQKRKLEKELKLLTHAHMSKG